MIDFYKNLKTKLTKRTLHSKSYQLLFHRWNYYPFQLTERGKQQGNEVRPIGLLRSQFILLLFSINRHVKMSTLRLNFTMNLSTRLHSLNFSIEIYTTLLHFCCHCRSRNSLYLIKFFAYTYAHLPRKRNKHCWLCH